MTARIALWGGREILGLLIVSLLAGTATISYIAYHFHRISPYGVIANLIAMAGCVGKLRDGSLVAIVKTVEAFEEDCRRAVLVVSARDAPLGCATLLVDRNVWQRSGAMALRRRGDQFEFTATRPPGYDRPWARAVAELEEAPMPGRTTPQRPRDATPRADDLELRD